LVHHQRSAAIVEANGLAARLLDQFKALHGDVAIELILSDANRDIIGGGIDLALRYGVQQHSSLKIRKLANSQRIICAAPSYIERRGRPETPEQLAAHDSLVMIFGEEKKRPLAVQSSWPVLHSRGFRQALPK
jgi:DNA-binding transcriptional LysR family regulator